MRKQDIKPGVVYAYQNRSYGAPDPAVLLTTALYSKRHRYDGDDKPWCYPAGEGSKPGKNYLGQRTGYVFVCETGPKDGETREQLHARMLAVTVADLEATQDGKIGDGLYFTVLTRLNEITGLYGEMVAARETELEAKRVKLQQDEDRRAENKRRAAVVLAAFEAAGVKGRYWDHDVTLSLEGAEKLAALLSSTPVPGTPDAGRN